MVYNVMDISTSCGMWGVWDYDEYSSIVSYEEWDQLFCDDKDIESQIAKHKFVPINIHSDGCFRFMVKVNEGLNDREKKFVLVQSGNYSLKSTGKAVLSGIENIGSSVDRADGLVFDLLPGGYTISIYLIEWDREPGMRLPNQTPHTEALPDFIVIIHSAEDGRNDYCKGIETFQ